MEALTKKIIALAVAIVVIVSGIVTFFALEKDNSPSARHPFIRSLTFSNLPPLNISTKLTYTISLHPSYYDWYGIMSGTSIVNISLPDGFVSLSENTTIYTDNLILGEEPVTFTWSVKPIQTGNWTIIVFNQYNCTASKNGRTTSANTTDWAYISIHVSEDSSYLIDTSYHEPSWPSDGLNQTFNGSKSARTAFFVDSTVNSFEINSTENESQILEPLDLANTTIFTEQLFSPIYDNNPEVPTPNYTISMKGTSYEIMSPGNVKVVGYIYYNDPELGTRPARWLLAKFMDKSIFGDSVKDTAIVQSNGYFESDLISNSDEWGTLDIYVEFVPDSSAALVNQEYGFGYATVTSTYWDVPDGTLNVGSWTTGTHGAYRIYEYLMDGWDYIANGPASWIPPKVTATWTDGHSANYGVCDDWIHYHSAQSWQLFYHTMHITSGHASSPDVILHEYGHHIMFCAYNDWISPNAQGDHDWDWEVHQDLAWPEGWADFFPGPARGDIWLSDYLQDERLNLETRQIGSISNPAVISNIVTTGDDVEANVAGALYDIYDSNNDGNDTFNGGFAPIWNIIYVYNDYNFADFWGSCKSLYSGNNALIHYTKAAIYQNTIDYNNAPNPSFGPLYILSSPTNGYYSGTIDLAVYNAWDQDTEDLPYLRCRFEYSADGGTTWNLISETTNNLGTRTASWATATLSAGQYKLRAFLHDGMEQRATAQVTISIDNTAPTNPTSYTSTPAVNTWSTDNTIYVSWSGASDGGSGIAGYSIQWTTSSTTIPDTVVDTTGTSTTSSALSDSSTWYLHIRTKDNAGNWNAGAYHVGPFKIDTTGPTGSISINSGSAWTSSTSVTLGLTYSDGSGSGVYQVRYSNDGSTWTVWESPSATRAWTLTSGDGTKTVYYRIRDNALIESITYSDTIGLDTTAPTGSISINSGNAWTTTTSVTLTLTYTDTGSGIYQVRYSNDGTWDTETWETPSSTKAWTLTTGDGTKTVYYQVKNNAGLISSTYSDTIGLDTTAPTGSIIINSGNAWTTTTTVTLTLTYTDTGSGVYQVRYTNDGTFDTEAWESPSATKAWTLTTGTGTKTVYYQIKDNAGTISTTYSDTIGLDTIAPTGSIIINNGNAWTTTTTVTLTLTYTDTGSGVYQVRYTNDGTFDTEAWESPSATKAWTLTTGDGTKTVYYQIKDNAGMISTTYSDTIGLDTIAPTGSIIINSGNAWTTTTSVTLTLTYADTGSGVSQVRYSNDGTFDTETWESSSATKVWTLTTGDGTKTVYYQIKDNAGMISTTYSDTIGLDTIAPTGSIIINSGNAWTTTTIVTLTLTYTDTSSGVYQVRYSNDGVWDTEPWESPSATKSWTLASGDGTKTVYYQIKDNAGFISTIYSDTIGLDTTAPTGYIIINSGNAWTSTTSVTLSLTYVDAGSGSGVYQVQCSNDGAWDTEPWESPSATKSWTLASGDGTKTVYYRIRDNALVESITYSDTIGLDTTAPPSITGVTANIGEPAVFAYDDCNSPSTTPHLIRGTYWQSTVVFDGTYVAFYYTGLNPSAQYQITIRYWTSGRLHSCDADGFIVHGSTGAETVVAVIPSQAYADGSMTIKMYKAPGSQNNACVNDVLIVGPEGSISNVFISWTAPTDMSDVTYYRIYRAQILTGPYTIIHETLGGANPLSTSWTDVGAGNGNVNNYFYKLATIDKAGNEGINNALIAGKYCIPLNYNWNFVSIPLIQSDTYLPKVLQSVGWNFVQYYDALDMSNHWKTNHILRADSLDDLWTINHRMGFWIQPTTIGDVLEVAGAVPITTGITLQNGDWNMIGFPSFTDKTVGQFKSENPKVTIIEGFDPTQEYSTRVMANTEMMSEGYAYWVQVSIDPVVELSNFDVKIRFNSSDIELSNYTPSEGDMITIHATIHNDGNTSSQPLTVQFYLYETGEQIAVSQIPSIPAYSAITIEISWVVRGGTSTLWGVVDFNSDRTDGYIAEGFSQYTVINRAPVPIIKVYQPVNVTLSIMGTPGNSVTLYVVENGTAIAQMTVTRIPGSPSEQSQTITFNKIQGYTYELILVYNATNKGSNPVIITLESGTSSTCLHENFKSKDGLIQTKVLDISDALETILDNNRTFYFDASESYDVDGSIVSHVWNFGDGTTSGDSLTSHTYAAPGYYIVQLRLIDDDGTISTWEFILQVR
jgi:hypothetical protein